jgi:hypothetical protein
LAKILKIPRSKFTNWNIDVNIMTKLDKENFEKCTVAYQSLMMLMLRFVLNSTVVSSLVLSAGMNLDCIPISKILDFPMNLKQ